MVEIEEIIEDEAAPPPAAAAAAAAASIPPSEERLLDAQEIEKAMESVTRPTARMHLEALVKKLRKESDALKRVEASKAKAEAAAAAAPPPAPKVVPPPPPPPRAVPQVSPQLPSAPKYTSIDRFSFDAGKYNSPHVMLYIPLPGVGSLNKEEKISCDFTSTSFDLIVRDLNGKSFRLFKDNLDKDIVPEKSKYIVKADKIVVKLAKVKSEYGSYDHWSDLVDKKKTKASKQKTKDNPAAGIMDLMKDMYDNGDDNMRKMIGETMMKQRNGELGRDGMGGMGDMGMGGL